MRSNISYPMIRFSEIMYEESILYCKDIDSQSFYFSLELLSDHQRRSYLMLIESFWIRYISPYPACSFEFWGIFIEISQREGNYSCVAISRSEEHIFYKYIRIIRFIYICQLKRSSSNNLIPSIVAGYLLISGNLRVRIQSVTALMSDFVRSISPSWIYSVTRWNLSSLWFFSMKKSSNCRRGNALYRSESSNRMA